MSSHVDRERESTARQAIAREKLLPEDLHPWPPELVSSFQERSFGAVCCHFMGIEEGSRAADALKSIAGQVQWNEFSPKRIPSWFPTPSDPSHPHTTDALSTLPSLHNASNFLLFSSPAPTPRPRIFSQVPPHIRLAAPAVDKLTTAQSPPPTRLPHSWPLAVASAPWTYASLSPREKRLMGLSRRDTVRYNYAQFSAPQPPPAVPEYVPMKVNPITRASSVRVAWMTPQRGGTSADAASFATGDLMDAAKDEERALGRCRGRLPEQGAVVDDPDLGSHRLGGEQLSAAAVAEATMTGGQRTSESNAATKQRGGAREIISSRKDTAGLETMRGSVPGGSPEQAVRRHRPRRLAVASGVLGEGHAPPWACSKVSATRRRRPTTGERRSSSSSSGGGGEGVSVLLSPAAVQSAWLHQGSVDGALNRRKTGLGGRGGICEGDDQALLHIDMRVEFRARSGLHGGMRPVSAGQARRLSSRVRPKSDFKGQGTTVGDVVGREEYGGSMKDGGRRKKRPASASVGGGGKKGDKSKAEDTRVAFLGQAYKYVGVPYKKGAAMAEGQVAGELAREGLFLDCCGLVRRVLTDLWKEFGFLIGPWNQSYMFDTLKVKLSVDEMRPGDLVFIEGRYHDETKRRSKHDIVHVEIWTGGGPFGKGTLGARRQMYAVEEHETYEVPEIRYAIVAYHFRSIDTWLKGECKSHCTKHPWVWGFAGGLGRVRRA